MKILGLTLLLSLSSFAQTESNLPFVCNIKCSPTLATKYVNDKSVSRGSSIMGPREEFWLSTAGDELAPGPYMFYSWNENSCDDAGVHWVEKYGQVCGVFSVKLNQDNGDKTETLIRGWTTKAKTISPTKYFPLSTHHVKYINGSKFLIASEPVVYESEKSLNERVRSSTLAELKEEGVCK